MKLPLILAVLFGTISNVVSEDVPVTKCCSNDQYYDTGHNECANVTGSNENWSVPVSSRPGTSPKLYSLNKLNVTENLQICPDGYLVQSTRQFLLFDNGTLSVSATPSTLLPGTFCIERALHSAHESIEIIIARFCRPDPCNAAACVKKCCPEGHSFEGETCVPSSSAFPLKFNNEKGDTVPLQEGSYAIRAGGLPSCPDKTLLDPFEYQEDEFVILPTGQLFVPVFKNGPVLDDYCIEDFAIYADDGTDEYQRKAVVCLMPVTLTAGERFVLTIYSYLLFFASIFLVATFVVYLIIPEIRNIHGVTVMCHCASLAGTFICIGIINLKNDFDFVSCVVLAVFTHFFFLSSFTWLNVLSFDIWWTLRDLRPTSPRRGYGANRIKSRFAYYSIYAWGVPVIIVAVGQILDHVPDLPSSILTPDFGELKCWFSGLDNAILAYLYGPIATLLVSNVIFFTLTAIHLHNAQKDSKIATKRKKKKEK